jgi:hypothetical protein
MEKTSIDGDRMAIEWDILGNDMLFLSKHEDLPAKWGVGAGVKP